MKRYSVRKNTKRHKCRRGRKTLNKKRGGCNSKHKRRVGCKRRNHTRRRRCHRGGNLTGSVMPFFMFGAQKAWQNKKRR